MNMQKTMLINFIYIYVQFIYNLYYYSLYLFMDDVINGLNGLINYIYLYLVDVEYVKFTKLRYLRLYEAGFVT